MQISANVVTLVVLQVMREKFITRKLTKEESFPSLSVRQNRANTRTQSKALYPPTQKSPTTNQVLAHGLLATRAK